MESRVAQPTKSRVPVDGWGTFHLVVVPAGTEEIYTYHVGKTTLSV
jgi:hypothetical protein